MLQRGNNAPVMFLRAPKHFKRGKHHIFYFNSRLQKHFTFNYVKVSVLHKLNGLTLYKLGSSLQVTFFNDLLLSRVSFCYVGSLHFLASVLFLQLIINAFFFSFIFWGLTFIAKYTYSAKYYDYKLNFYECGFKNLDIKRPRYEVNFLVILLFLLIYDGEFLVLIPFSLNPSLITFGVCCVFLFFMIWFIIVLVFDYIFLVLEWQVNVL